MSAAPAAAKPPGILGILRRLPRSLLLRCPHCDAFPLLRTKVEFHDTCGNCGYRFIVEDGDFWGGVVFSYTFAGISGMLCGLLLTVAGWFPWDTNVYISAGVALVTTVVSYPWAKAAWVHLLYLTRGQYADYAPPDPKDAAAR